MLKKSKKSENNQSFFRVGFLEAIRNNWNEEVKQLILENETGINNNTLLMDASRLGNLEILKFSIERGADINYKMGNQTALIEASAGGHLEIVKYLVENGAEDINNALMSASASGHLETVKYLIENGANINITNHLTDRTILMTAVRNGNLEVVQYLIECGADVNAKSRSGEIALIIASIRGYCEIVKCLAENGANDINDALIEASKSGKLGAVKCLAEHGADIDYKDNNGKTALMSALENEKLRIVAYFIERCGDINAKYDYEYYISEGIEETEYDKENIFGKYKGMTILMIASLLGKLETVKYLIKNGADVNIENYKCDTALDLTEKAYIDKEIKDEIIKALKEAGAI